MMRVLARALEAPLVVSAPFEPLDAIVVLGSPLGPGDALTPVLAERARAAAALFHAGGAPLVVTTGGPTRGAHRSEAEVLAEALHGAGVPDVLVEAAARSTADNARLTAALLAPRGVHRVWLVTQPFHGRRAARLFRTAGLEPHVWHIADSLEYADRARAVRWCLREYVSWAALAIRR